MFIRGRSSSNAILDTVKSGPTSECGLYNTLKKDPITMALGIHVGSLNGGLVFISSGLYIEWSK